ncbi:MAG: enoyl-CoA hydratase-related protein [Acidimicrobiales bacterium]
MTTTRETSASTFVHLDREGDVAVIRLDRPKVNALSIEMLEEFASVVGQLSAEPPGAVVIWGGERIFAAGADVSEFLDAKSGDSLVGAFTRAFDDLAALPRVTIAAIAGYALGGGCELALACDFRFMTSTAKLGQPEVLLGLIPGAGGTQRLARLVGPARAKELILSGRQVGADEAFRIGLVDRIVDDELLLSSAVEFGRELASGALLAQSLAKRAIDAAAEMTLTEGLVLERELFSRAMRSDDAQNGIRSFLEHGPGHAKFSDS